MKLEILFEDNHLLVINKPIGILVQGDKTGDIPLVDLAKAYIKQKYNIKTNDGRQFGPSVLAPFSKVTLQNDAGFSANL